MPIRLLAMARPPSYKDAIATKDTVMLFSGYLNNEALVNGTLVCRAWNKVMNPQIWEDPIRFCAGRAHPFRKHATLYTFGI
jgi:hypothetical protein